MRLVITLSMSVLLSFGIASAVHGELSGAGTPPQLSRSWLGHCSILRPM